MTEELNKTTDNFSPAMLSSLAKQVGAIGTPLEDERLELYARFRAQGFTKSSALRTCIGDDIGVQALVDTSRVLRRIEELSEEYARQVMTFSPEQSLARWDDLYAMAMAAGKLKEAIAIQAQIDKVSGIIAATEKKKATEEGSLTFAPDPKDWKNTAKGLLEMLGRVAPIEVEKAPVLEDPTPVEEPKKETPEVTNSPLGKTKVKALPSGGLVSDPRFTGQVK